MESPVQINQAIVCEYFYRVGKSIGIQVTHHKQVFVSHTGIAAIGVIEIEHGTCLVGTPCIAGSRTAGHRLEMVDGIDKPLTRRFLTEADHTLTVLHLGIDDGWRADRLHFIGIIDEIGLLVCSGRRTLVEKDVVTSRQVRIQVIHYLLNRLIALLQLHQTVDIRIYLR